jgi:hypothetical protein
MNYLPNDNSIELSEPSPWYYPNTGIIWKVTKTISSSPSN